MQEYLLSLDKDYDDPKELEADILHFRAERNAAANFQKEEDEVCVLLFISLYNIFMIIFIYIFFSVTSFLFKVLEVLSCNFRIALPY